MVLRTAAKSSRLGLKRTREALDEDDVHHPPTARRRLDTKEASVANKFKTKLHHSIKEAQKAAKAAKAFELQRIVKRLKQLRKHDSIDDVLVKRTESELEILKSADHHILAKLSLSSKLGKDAVLSHNDACMSAMSEQLLVPTANPSLSSDEGKVWSRLLSSKKLASEVSSIVLALRAVVEPPSKGEKTEITSKGWKEQKLVQRKDHGSGGANLHQHPVNILPSTGRPSQDGGNDESEVSERGEDTQIAPWLGVGLDSDEEGGAAEAFDSDVDAVDAAGWESGSIHGSESVGSQDEDEESDDQSLFPQRTAAAKSRPSIAKPGASMFLPALNVGYIGGGSDGSDYDEVDAKGVDGPERKNRRGQRARKAIWEKKYGKNANHIKKQREEEQRAGRGRGRPNPRGAGVRGGGFSARGLSSQSFVPDRGWKGRQPGFPSMPSTNQDISGRQPQNQQPPVDDRPLHPSWVAKRKEKEAAHTTLPQGKKIVFD